MHTKLFEGVESEKAPTSGKQEVSTAAWVGTAGNC